MEEEGDEEANESFYRYGNRRDKWLINEAKRLLMEAEDEGSAADIFDMEREDGSCKREGTFYGGKDCLRKRSYG